MKKWNFAGSAVAVAAAFALAAVPQMASATETPTAQPEQATQQTTPKTPAPAEKPADTNTKPTLTQPAAPTEQKPAPQTEPATPKIGTRATCTSPDTDENIIGDHAYWKLSPDCTTLTLGTQTGHTNGTLPDVHTYQPWASHSSTITSVKFDSPVKANANSAQLFHNLPNVTSIDLTNFNTTGATAMNHMFDSDPLLTTITFTSAFNTSAVTDMQYMFCNDPALTTFVNPTFDTGNVTNMFQMFYGDTALSSIPMVSTFNTSKVTNMSGMFYGDKALTSLNLSSFDTKNVTDMSQMFCLDTALTYLYLPSTFDTSKVTNMRLMFCQDTALTYLSLPSTFDTSKVTTMKYMFAGDSNLYSIYLSSNFKTPLVTDMSGMFGADPALTRLDLSSFDTTTTRALPNQTDMFDGDDGLEFVRAGGTAVFDNTTNMPTKNWTNEAGSWNGHPSDGFGNSDVMWYGDPGTATATFDANGAEGTAPAPVSIALWPDASTEITLPGQGNMTKKGYTFLGWAEDRNAQNLDATDSGKAGEPYDTYGASFTLYAVWVKDAPAAAQNGQKGKELGKTGATVFGILVAAIVLAAAGWGVFRFRKVNED